MAKSSHTHSQNKTLRMYAKPFEKNNFTTALDAIDDTFDHYVTYDNGDDINKKSVDTFLNKIGGYLYINSLPPVD